LANIFALAARFELYQDLALSNLSEKVSASTFGSGIAKEGA
jgi:hypothetical protein